MGGFGVVVSGEWALCSAGCDDVRDSEMRESGWCVVLLERVDFGSRGRLHATAFRPSARVANPTPRQNEPQGEGPDP